MAFSPANSIQTTGCSDTALPRLIISSRKKAKVFDTPVVKILATLNPATRDCKSKDKTKRDAKPA